MYFATDPMNMHMFCKKVDGNIYYRRKLKKVSKHTDMYPRLRTTDLSADCQNVGVLGRPVTIHVAIYL